MSVENTIEKLQTTVREKEAKDSCIGGEKRQKKC
jgi:hypothetical protein